MTGRWPRTLRNRLTLVVALGTGVLLIALIAGFNLVLRHQIRSDLDGQLRARASAALANVDTRGGTVAVREAPGDQAIDQQLWVFAGQRAIERPGDGVRFDAAAAAAARRPRHFTDAGSLDLRLYATPIRASGRTIGAVVAGRSLAAYETTVRRALVASIFLGLLILIGVLAAIRLAIGAALRPVDQMTSEAQAWSIEDLDHRFVETDTHDELSRLAATFNNLLARLAASFRHEQRFSAEMSHELRTPLAKLVVESELALRRERTSDEYRAALQGVVDDASQMQGVIETLLAVARSEIDPRSGTSDARNVVETVVESVRATEPSVDVAVSASAGDLRLGVDGDLAERVLAPVVVNALEFATRHASIGVRRAGSAVEFVVADDGPGVRPADRELIFSPGFRAPGGRQNGGAGLGLALARRLARTAGGDVVCDEGNRGGAFVVSLPAA